MKIYALVFIISCLSGMKQDEPYQKSPLKPLKPGVTLFDEYIALPNNEGVEDSVEEIILDENLRKLEKEIDKHLKEIKKERNKKKHYKHKSN